MPSRLYIPRPHAAPGHRRPQRADRVRRCGDLGQPGEPASPRLKPRGLETAGATTHVLVDFERSKVTDRRESWPYFNSLKIRADLLARLMASRPGVEYIARRAGVSARDIAAVAPVTAGVQSVLTEPGSEQRAQEILLADKRYRLEIQNKPDAPIIDIYAQAPSPAEAEKLANASIEGLRDYLSALAAARASIRRPA